MFLCEGDALKTRVLSCNTVHAFTVCIQLHTRTAVVYRSMRQVATVQGHRVLSSQQRCSTNTTPSHISNSISSVIMGRLHHPVKHEPSAMLYAGSRSILLCDGQPLTYLEIDPFIRMMVPVQSNVTTSLRAALIAMACLVG